MKIPLLPSPAFFIGGQDEHRVLPLVAVAAPQSVVVTSVDVEEPVCGHCASPLWATLENAIEASVFIDHVGGRFLYFASIGSVCICQLEFPDEELLEAMREGEVSHG